MICYLLAIKPFIMCFLIKTNHNSLWNNVSMAIRVLAPKNAQVQI